MIITVFIWFVFIIGFYFTRRCPGIHLGVVALGMNAVIGTFFPAFYNMVEIKTWRNLSNYSDNIGQNLQLEYLAYGFGLLWPILFTRSSLHKAIKKLKTARYSRNYIISRDYFICFSLLFAGILLYGYYIHLVGFNTLFNNVANLSEKYKVSSGLGPLAFGLNILTVCYLWAESSQFPKKILYLFRLLAIALMYYSIVLMHVRTYSFIIILGFLFIYFKEKEINLWRIKGRLTVIFILLWSCVEIIGLLRGVRGGDVQPYIANMKMGTTLNSMVGGSEFTHPFITSFELYNKYEAGIWSGVTYWNSLLILIPKSIYPSRPESSAEWFVKRFYPSNYRKGQGTAFSMVGEAWLNFGSLIGPFMIGSLIGLIICIVINRSLIYPYSSTSRLLAYFLFIVIMSERYAFNGTMKSISMIAFIVFILNFCFQLVMVSHITFKKYNKHS
jgi:hypothetical protein